MTPILAKFRFWRIPPSLILFFDTFSTLSSADDKHLFSSGWQGHVKGASFAYRARG
jgi:hypothetical protein